LRATLGCLTLGPLLLLGVLLFLFFFLAWGVDVAQEHPVLVVVVVSFLIGGWWAGRRK